jgi:hypothetical protein
MNKSKLKLCECILLEYGVMVLPPHIAILLQELLFSYLSFFEFLLHLHGLFIDSLCFLLNHFNELLLIDRSFFLVVLFKEFLQLVLLLIKLVVQFLILCQLFLYGFVVLYVGL